MSVQAHPVSYALLTSWAVACTNGLLPVLQKGLWQVAPFNISEDTVFHVVLDRLAINSIQAAAVGHPPVSLIFTPAVHDCCKCQSATGREPKQALSYSHSGVHCGKQKQLQSSGRRTEESSTDLWAL